jgi:hypothetical protein
MIWDTLAKLLLDFLISEINTLSGRVNLTVLLIFLLIGISKGWNFLLENPLTLLPYFVLIVFSAVLSDHISRSKSRRRRMR